MSLKLDMKVGAHEKKLNIDLSEMLTCGDILDISSVENTPRSVLIRGLKMWVVGSQIATIREYDLTVSGRIRDAVYSGHSFDCSTFEVSPSGLALSDDGLYMLVGGFASDSIHTIEMSTANTLNGASRNALKTLDVSGSIAGLQGICLSFKDTRLSIIDATTDTLFEYNINVSDISTATLNGSQNLTSIESSPQDIYFINNEYGIITGTQNDEVQLLKITGGIGNYSAISGNKYDTTSIETLPRGAYIDKYGKRLIICGSEVGKIQTLSREYNSIEELQVYEVENTDYRINTQAGTSEYCAIAIHGGGIERGSQETQEAFQTLFGCKGASFEGLKSSGNFVMHITSTKFNEPTILSLVESCQKTISFHGTAGVTETTYVGGTYEALKTAIESELTSAGFTISETPEYLDGNSPQNVANRCVTGLSVQLEISKALRDTLIATPSTMTSYVTAIKTAIDSL